MIGNIDRHHYLNVQLFCLFGLRPHQKEITGYPRDGNRRSLNLDCFVTNVPRNDMERMFLSLRAKRSNLKMKIPMLWTY